MNACTEKLYIVTSVISVEEVYCYINENFHSNNKFVFAVCIIVVNSLHRLLHNIVLAVNYCLCKPSAQ